MALDNRSNYLQTARLWMGPAMNPFSLAIQEPLNWWNWLTGSFSDRATLRVDNERLSRELRDARVRLLQFDALSEENRRLRAIRAASEGIAGRTLIAEIMKVSLEPFRHRVRINKGSEDGVFKGQPVLD